MNRLLLLCFLGALSISPAVSAEPYSEGEVLFVRRVLPLLQDKCFSCHGDDQADIKSEFDMRSLDNMLVGGESGEPGLVPGEPDDSPVYLSATRAHEDDWEPMPPKEAQKLTAEQLGWLHDWIQADAPWPEEERRRAIQSSNAKAWEAEDGVQLNHISGESAEWSRRRYRPEDLWAYQDIRRVAPPGNAANPVDAFLDAKRPEALRPAPPADRRTLLRRVTFDLTGFPPAPEEMSAFLNDPAPDLQAFETVVDRLLASPHYGERMAQHWLDVVRYADSSGFANDFERGNSWRYRDYVVRAFNQDKPYNQFVREQLAGDELDPGNPEMLIATGFLRSGPWELTSMEVPRVARQRFLDDVVNSVGETFLAHSLQCARCHDHKFDPVPTRDYYRMQAVFATTQLAERPAPFLAEENTRGFEERRFFEAEQKVHQESLNRINNTLMKNAQAWFQENQKDPAVWNQVVAKGKKNFGAARSEMMRLKIPESEFPPRLVGLTPEEFGFERIARKGLQRLAWVMDRYQPVALSVYNGPTRDVKAVVSPVRYDDKLAESGAVEKTCILPGGDPFGEGAPVSPGALSAIPQVPAAFPVEVAGRRSALADWITDERNPLPARVMANRIWLWHFGRGLAGNPNNFGSTGKRPTHPELLDYLASELKQGGWRLKPLHRLILTSEAYRRSAQAPDPERLRELDPEQSSYTVFVPRRLSAEELRDAMLRASGELNPVMGGIPNRPDMQREAALQPRMVMGTFASAWTVNPLPAQRHRRSLYALRLRGLTDPLLEVFNAPPSDFSCEKREVSSVTPQVFALWNGRDAHARALALADRAMKAAADDTAALQNCFQWVLNRPATLEELDTFRQHWQQVEDRFGGMVVDPDPPAVEVWREAVEEETGERFRFREILHAHQEYVPDLRPSDVTPKTRALADLCLVLFNSNEFAYVY